MVHVDRGNPADERYEIDRLLWRIGSVEQGLAATSVPTTGATSSNDSVRVHPDDFEIILYTTDRPASDLDILRLVTSTIVQPDPANPDDIAIFPGLTP